MRAHRTDEGIIVRRYARPLAPWQARAVLLVADVRRYFSSERNRVILANVILYAVGLGLVTLVITPR